MSRNIVVCSDGTGNSATKGRGTNVFKLYEAVDVSGPEQIAIYDDGVGTQKLKILRVLAGAVGYGLSRNVKQLYTEICRVYRPGDRLYLFGFSRGAFTARTLAGFIGRRGLVQAQGLENAELKRAVAEEYRNYRKGSPAVVERVTSLFTGLLRKAWRVIKKPATVELSSVDVTFLGVWDTVDSVGFPIWGIDLVWNRLVYHFKFPDPDLPDCVQCARHALAIDEERGPFQPLLWSETPKDRLSIDGRPPRIKQVWFAGVHSDIGGGYPKQGLSMIALDWMISEAMEVGHNGEELRFRAGLREQYRTAGNADGYIHDSRSGFGVYYRYKPRSIQGLTDEPAPKTLWERIKARFRKGAAEERKPLVPLVHRTAIERILNRTQGYAPGNLPRRYAVVDGPAPREITIDDRPEEAGPAAAFAPAQKWLAWRRWVQVGFFVAQIFVISAAINLSSEDARGIFATSRTYLQKGFPGRLYEPATAAAAADGESGYTDRLAGWTYEVANDLVAPVPSTLVEERLIPSLFGHPLLGFTFLLLFPLFYYLGLIGRSRMESLHTRAWHALSGRLRAPEPAPEASATAQEVKEERPAEASTGPDQE